MKSERFKQENLFKAIDFLIRIEQGPDQGKLFLLTPPKITIGRDPSCQISLSDPKVSRQQIQILFDNNIICEDLSGRQSSFINGQPCRRSILKPGDQIQFGDTLLKFEAKTKNTAPPGLTGSQKTSQGGSKPKNSNFLRTLIILLIAGAGLMLLLEENKTPAVIEKLITTEDLTRQIEESHERSSQLEESRQTKRKMSSKKYLYGVERHFISGFRDFQNGRYERALDSFGTTIATEPAHTKARLYAKAARRKRSQLVEAHLRDGQKYKEKLMYNRCAAEYEKALVLLNDKNSSKYELAKAQRAECRLLQEGGY